MGVDKAQAVGTHESRAGRSAEVGDFALEHSACFVDFLEPRRNDDDRLGLRFQRAEDGPLYGGGGHADDAHVDRLAVVLEARIELVPHELAAGRVDRDDIALESSFDKVGHDRVTHLACGTGRTHDRDAFRIKEKLKHMPTTSSRHLPQNEARKHVKRRTHGKQAIRMAINGVTNSQ
jgi:hypothetical protein